MEHYQRQRDQLIDELRWLIGESDPVRTVLFKLVVQLSDDISDLETDLQEAQDKIHDLEHYR